MLFDGSHTKARVGTTLKGKYHLDRVLGEGGMAAVYKATHRNQAEFAVKMLHPALSMTPDICRRFLREGYAANTVKHRGVVLVVDDDVAEDGSAFLVMELLEGASVDELMNRSLEHLPVDGVIAIGVQLLDVLAAAHEKGVVHRDIKPANLFATKEGVLKVLDFGIARVRDAAVTSSQATSAGTLLGTPAFMPPEQAACFNDKIDHRSDIWSVGATLFALLTDTFVHIGPSAPVVLAKAATEHATPIRNVAPNVPEALATVIDCALNFERDDRWQSAAEMRDALRALATKDERTVLESLVRPSVLPPAKPPLSRDDFFAATENQPPRDSKEPPISAAAASIIVPSSSANALKPPSSAERPGGTTSQAVASNIQRVEQPAASHAEQEVVSEPKRSRLPLVAGAVGIAALLGYAVWGQKHDPVTAHPSDVAPPAATSVPAPPPVAPAPAPDPAPQPVNDPPPTPTPNRPVVTPIVAAGLKAKPSASAAPPPPPTASVKPLEMKWKD